MFFSEYGIEYKHCIAIPDYQTLKNVFNKLFGTDNIKLSQIFGMCLFLEKSYLHEFNNPIMYLLEFYVNEDSKKVYVGCEGINVMLILLCPQEIDPLNPVARKSVNSTTQRRTTFVYRQLNYKTMSDDTDRIGLELSDSTLGNVTSDYASKHWIAISNKCSLPWMYLTQPCGFYLEKEKKTSQIYVYIYLSLSTDSNCKRLLYNEDRMKGIRNSLTNRNEKLTAGKGVDGSAVMIHPFSVEQLSEQRKENMHNEFDICSPLSNCAPNIKNDDFFANRKYTASLFTTTSLTKLLSVVFKRTKLEDMFTEIPTADRKNNKRLIYEISVYLNLFEQVCEKYGYFKSRRSFVELFYDLVDHVSDETGFQFPVHHVEKSNIVHITRLLFRFIVSDIGLMFLDGNCRNYSVCLAYSRSTKMNDFLCQPIPSALSEPEPNYEECAKILVCDYLVHPYSKTPLTSPYSNVKEQYVALSEFAYKNSTSANVLTCQQTADRFFNSIVQHGIIYKPHDTQRRWSEVFIKNNYMWHKDYKKHKSRQKEKQDEEQKNSIKKSEEDGDKAEVGWMYFVNDWFMNSKKSIIYSELFEKNPMLFTRNKDAILYSAFTRDLSHKHKSFEQDYQYEKKFSIFCCQCDPLLTRISVFRKLNILVTMARYLSLLVCQGKDDIGELLTTLRVFVNTNGIHEQNPSTNDFTIGLRNGWILKSNDCPNPIDVNMGVSCFNISFLYHAFDTFANTFD